jgi:hypothetical protein
LSVVRYAYGMSDRGSSPVVEQILEAAPWFTSSVSFF